MADLSITAASVIASANATVYKQYNFGATVTTGQVVYLDSSNTWQLKDANASSTGNLVNSVTGVSLVGGANGQPAAVVVKDSDFTPGGTLSNGASYYASPNAGAVAPAADVTTGNYPTFLFVAKSTTKAHLNPTGAGIAV